VGILSLFFGKIVFMPPGTIIFDDVEEGAKLLAPEDHFTKLATGFKFVEGPVWMPTDGTGNSRGRLYFSDIPNDAIHTLSAAGDVQLFRKPSHQTNGNTIDLQGRLVSCEGGARRVTRTEKNGSVTVVADAFQGRKLNSPNDVVVKSDGAIYFSDPTYGLGGGEKEQAGNYVFRVDPKTSVLTKAADGFDQPNGLCFSPDETTLYVADSGKPHHVKAFPVHVDGTLGEGEVFCEIDKGVPDGMRCDREGRLYSTAGDGVHIFLATGKRIGKIFIPEVTANCAFGGENGKTLFMTAMTSVYAIQLRVAGAK